MEIFELLAGVYWGAVAVGFIAFLLIGVFLENEHIGSAFVATLVGLALVSIVSVGFNTTAELFLDSPEMLAANIGNIGIYLLIGVVWSIFKWTFYVRKIGKSLVERLSKAINDRPKRAHHLESYFCKIVDEINSAVYYLATSRLSITDIDKDVFSKIVTAKENARFEPSEEEVTLVNKALEGITPETIINKAIEKLEFTPSHKKGLIGSWILYWPISALSTMISEMLVNLISNIIDSIRGIYNKISQYTISRALRSALKSSLKV